jgi:hypothetical protein
MTKAEFHQLFAAALERATQHAEKRLGQSIPRYYSIELHGAGHSGDVMTTDEAVNALQCPISSHEFLCVPVRTNPVHLRRPGTTHLEAVLSNNSWQKISP